jgi:hypothetical protein
VVALVAALGHLHLAQKSVHFVQSQAAVGTHRTVAGHGCQQCVVRALDHRAGILLGQFGQHAAGQFHGIALGQAGRDRAHGQCSG